MTRRAALATAGAITIVLLAAAAALAANQGVLRVAPATGTAGEPVSGLTNSQLAPSDFSCATLLVLAMKTPISPCCNIVIW